MTAPEGTSRPAPSTPAEFAECVGRAVLAWQDVELRCAHLYAWLLDARNAQGAITSFHAVHSMTLRAMMLKTSARYLFQSPEFQDLADEFDEHMTSLAACSRLRNRLSHSEVAEELTEAGWVYSLTPSAIDAAAAELTRGAGRIKNLPLDFAAIKAAEGQFRAIAESLHALEEQLRERLESL